MENAVTGRTPMHLWIVGGVASVWNALGASGYMVSRLHDADLMAKMAPSVDPQSAFAYADSMPIWASFGWGLGIWTALLGSLLLLARSRYAVHAFGLSLIGIALS